MSTEFKLSYTGSQINEKLGKIDSLAAKSEIPTHTSDLTNDSDFTTKSYVHTYAQPVGDYALHSEIPSVPTAVSAFANDVGYITDYTETDPTVPAWAKASTKPRYTASEVGADASGSAAQALSDANDYTDSNIEAISEGFSNVISQMYGSDLTEDGAPTIREIANSEATTAADQVKNDLLNGAGAAFDTLKELGDLITNNQEAIDALETIASGKANSSHTHVIADVSGLQSALDGKASSSHGTHVSYSTTAPVMDGTASVGSASTVARSDHKHPTDTSRAAKSDFDSHTGNTTTHITSAERSAWNAKANTSDIPTKVSQLTNDSKYLTSFTETDPTVPAWAKASTKPSYTATEVGALPASTVIPSKLSDLSADSTHRTVTDTEKSTWNAKANTSAIPTKVSQLTNDSGFITSAPVTSVNSKTGAVSLTASDVGADASGAASGVQTNLDTHTGNTAMHITSTERSNWNSAKTKADAALPAAGGNVTGHIYLTGAKPSSSTGNTSQIVFGTASDNHVVLSSNTAMLVINPTISSSANQILLKLGDKSQFPQGLTTGDIISSSNNTKSLGTSSNKWKNVYATTFTGNLTGTASNATADANGNNIVDTYVTKAELYDEIASLNVEPIVQQVIAALGTPVFGQVDANNNIILSGALAEGVYTLKYEDAEGNLIEIGTFNSAGDTPVVEIVNWIKKAIESDGTLYNGGKGWKADTRLSSSGSESTSNATGTEVTGFIEFKIGDVLRFKNMKITGTDSNNTTQYIVFYTSTKTKIHHVYTHQLYGMSNQQSNFTLDSSGYWKSYDTKNLAASNTSATWSDLKYFRISAEEITDDSIITINQEIE